VRRRACVLLQPEELLLPGYAQELPDKPVRGRPRPGRPDAPGWEGDRDHEGPPRGGSGEAGPRGRGHLLEPLHPHRPQPLRGTVGGDRDGARHREQQGGTAVPAEALGDLGASGGLRSGAGGVDAGGREHQPGGEAEGGGEERHGVPGGGGRPQLRDHPAGEHGGDGDRRGAGDPALRRRVEHHEHPPPEGAGGGLWVHLRARPREV